MICKKLLNNLLLKPLKMNNNKHNHTILLNNLRPNICYKFTGILILLIFQACTMNKYNADLIIKNAIIETLDETNPSASCLAIKNGKFIAIGTEDSILSNFTSLQIVDVAGKYIYPGFIDPHCHFYGYACNLRYAQLNEANSFQQILEIVQQHYKKNKTFWIVGRGWDQNKWPEQTFPNNKALNKLFPQNPVVLIRIDGHVALANDKALELAGFNENSVISGGLFEKENNKLTGILLDKACDSIRMLIPQPEYAELKKLLIKAQTNCFAVGLTSLADAGLDKNIIEAYDKLHKEGALQMRIYAMLNPTAENMEKYVKTGPYSTDFLHVKAIKLYSDGALGSRGAWLKQAYSDDNGNFGIATITEKEIDSICKIAYEKGFQVNTHAIGDAAVSFVLQHYAKLLPENNDRRWRIEHAQIVHPSDLPLFKKYAIIPAINAVHATSDMGWAKNRIGNIRIKYAYAYRNLLNQNNWLCNGSDFPIENINPLEGFYAAVARKNWKGKPSKGWEKQNAISRIDALKAMTIWAAKACFEEDKKGSIEPGKFADFVVLNIDLLRCHEDDIRKARVLYTYSNGKLVSNLDSGTH